MENTGLAWRTSSTEPVSDKGAERLLASRRDHAEETESQVELRRRRRADPEPTEEIRKSGNACDEIQATVTSPVPHGTKPGNGCDVDLADSGEDPSELVSLVVPEPDHAPEDIAPGEVIANRYLVLERVEHQGMGMVFKALDRHRRDAGSPQPLVALKFARTGGQDAAVTSSHLRQEFLKLSRLHHPNIVSAFDYDRYGGRHFIVMEWLDGQTLASLLMQITSKRLSLDNALHIVRSVGEALAYAHDLGIVHGDVKPSNIFVTNDRAVKLLDFGSSGDPDHGGEPNWATRAYASPAILHGQAPRAIDDVFALGVTAYCLLTGEHPFKDRDAIEASALAIEPDPLPPDAIEYSPAILRALAFEDSSRPAHAAAFLALFDEDDAHVGDAEETGPTRPATHIAYGAVAVAALIALVAWSVSSVSGLPVYAKDALEQARVAMEAERFVEPADDSAYRHYSTVLAAAPGNEEAQSGIERIAEIYLTRTRRHLDNERYADALSSLAIARDVMPEHYGIAVTQELLDRHGRDLVVDARQSVARDPDAAEARLDQAAELLPADDPVLLAAQRELEESRRQLRLDLLLRGIDERILSERLLVPRRDSAVALLDAARRLAAEDRQVRLAAERVTAALLFQAMFAVSNGDLGAAETYVRAARNLGVEHMALARAEYELAKAQHRQVTARRGGSGE